MYHISKIKLAAAVLRFVLISVSFLSAQGKVYLVLGSDTATWDGMNTNEFHCTYVLSLFTDPGRNAYKIMDPAFRNRHVDSFGQTVKLTWWMMGGNIFRYATNKDVPLPNTMTLYAMKKHHSGSIARFGDELTMHYHTFVWTDYDKDGIFWWNQAKNFTESAADFDVTLAQYLLEEGTFPVSFRSGWHAMDNDWQRSLDTLLPFSMHDAYPAIRKDTIEPLDNTYDWSKSSKEFVPFHPSPDNYQFPGSLKGYNLRSEYMASLDSASMVSIFAKANAGVDQVVCLWAHLPEEDFLTNVSRIDRLAHAAEGKYPTVKFRYCTAIEAMQRWLRTNDATPPTVTLSEKRAGNDLTFVVTSNEALFQPQPFVAVKDIYERYTRLRTRQTGPGEWTTIDPVATVSVAKVGVAATDTVGNVRTEFLRYLPDDIYVDNKDSAYTETAGTWATVSRSAWGSDARVATLGQSDSVKIQWKPTIPKSCRYNIFVQVPPVSNAAGKILIRVFSKGQVVQSTYFDKPLTTRDWVYAGTTQLDVGSQTTFEMVVKADGQAGKVVAADVFRLSALVRDRQIVVNNTSIDFGEVSEMDTVRYTLQIENRGTLPLAITSVRAVRSSVYSVSALPLSINPMQQGLVTLALSAVNRGAVSDTLMIMSDDPSQPVLLIPLTAKVVNYFQVADNDDLAKYREFGPWNTSVAQAYGPSSRYSAIPTAAGTYAIYSMILKKTGVYDIQIIVPKTVNASIRAKYLVRIGSTIADSVFVDQNVNSGSWVTILTRSLPGSIPIDIIVSDAITVAASGLVLRADALKCSLRQEVVRVEKNEAGVLPDTFVLMQNHPNPFNPSTRIEYAVPTSGNVSLRVFDMLGREVAVLVDGIVEAGWYSVNFNAQMLSSGIYLYRLESSGFAQTLKMVVLK
ncbi:MAG: T9SS type A sorting domain-containing protein [Ignavibacteria bacterium]|nr:T9SS type A sorting domain-containing protein [Ignavibacteria bacterium]